MKLIYILLISIGILFYNSCCTEKYCPNAPTIFSLSFEDSNQIRPVYIKIVSYQFFTNFTILQDSVESSFQNGHFIYLENPSFNVKNDFIVYVDDKKQLEITQIQYKNKKCNSCFPAGNDVSTSVTGFTINGTYLPHESNIMDLKIN